MQLYAETPGPWNPISVCKKSRSSTSSRQESTTKTYVQLGSFAGPAPEPVIHFFLFVRGASLNFIKFKKKTRERLPKQVRRAWRAKKTKHAPNSDIIVFQNADITGTQKKKKALHLQVAAPNTEQREFDFRIRVPQKYNKTVSCLG
jgi:hypothetical protein